MRISVNLATRPYIDLAPILKRLRIAAVAMVGLSALFGAGLYAIHYQAEAARARSAELAARINALEALQQQAQQRMRLPDNAKTLAQSEFLNKLIDEKTFSWTLAMEDLETVLPPGEQVTAIEPQRSKTGIVMLRLRVTGPRDKGIELVRNLEHSARFLMPRIVGENAESQTGTGSRAQQAQFASMPTPVNFDIAAIYNNDAPKPKAKKAKDDKSADEQAADTDAKSTKPGKKAKKEVTK